MKVYESKFQTDHIEKIQNKSENQDNPEFSKDFIIIILL